jgi:hypothetical protein
MSLDELPKDLLLLEEGITDSLEVLYLEFAVLAGFEEVGVVVSRLGRVGVGTEVVLLGVFTGWLEEAFDGEDRQVGSGSLV